MHQLALVNHRCDDILWTPEHRPVELVLFEFGDDGPGLEICKDNGGGVGVGVMCPDSTTAVAML